MKDDAKSGLMQDLLNETPSEELVEEKVETKEVKKDEPEVATITEEFAQKAGLPPSFVGKSMDELPKAIRNLQANYTQKSQALSELGKKVEQLEKTILSQGTKAEQKEAQEVIDEIPDPVTDRQAFNRWLENRDKRKETELEKKIGDMFESKFGTQIKTVEEYNNKQREQIIISTIQDGVDEGVDVQELIVEWATENGVLHNDKEIEYWTSNPEKMAKSVIAYNKAKLFDKLLTENEKQLGDKAVEKASKAIKESQEKKVTDLNSVKRTKDEKSTPLMKDLLDLVEE